MTWQEQIKGNPLAWLLDPGSPGVRYLALRDLAGEPPGSAELAQARRAAHRSGPIAAILAEMDPSGFWVEPGPGYNPKYKSTQWCVILLAQLGARIEDDPRIAKACAYTLDHALASGGQFGTSGAPSGTADCMQGNLCRALTELGSTDPRLETAFEWMARSVTGEGIAPQEDRNAALRYYAAKCGPNFACGANNRLPCAWGAVKVVGALASRPADRRTPLVGRALQQGVDFLFSADPAAAAYPAGFSAKPSQSWFKFGFPVFYVTDVLQTTEVLARLGYGNDPRLARALTFVLEKQDEQGRWKLEYDYTGKTWTEFGEKHQPSKWVTLRALRALKDADGVMLSAERR